MTSSSGPEKFAALKDRNCRRYLGGTFLSMMADNVEHVISYWVLWQAFRSEALAGFEVLSHWLPFLLLSVWSGGLADRFDCRRVIQTAQALYVGCALAWAFMFATDTLSVPAACVVLVVHGFAGTLWGPAEQLMLHDFVGPGALPSAIRLNATARGLGVLLGPVVGSALLLGLGPVKGMLANALIYLPLTFFLARTKFTGHTRDDDVRRVRLSALAAVRVLREVGRDRVILAMVVLAGLGSFFIGVALQSVMPIFAEDLGAGSAGNAYGVLLFANGVGGVVGGLLLELTPRIPPSVRTAVVATFLFGLTTLGFALTDSYALALALLVVGGVANLAAMTVGQTVVQLRAPAEHRGCVIGLFGMSANGLRFGSGITVGFAGGLIGVHASLAWSAGALCVATVAVALLLRRGGAAA